MKLYIIGSLNNPEVVEVTKKLRGAGFGVFSEWFCAGPDADQHWAKYGKAMGMDFMEMLHLDFVKTAFQFDYTHMQECDGCVLVMPAGKSAHCELGWFVGQGKKAYILYDKEPERVDLMPANLATGIYYTITDLIESIRRKNETKSSEYKLAKVSRKDLGIYHAHKPEMDNSYCICSVCIGIDRDLGRGGM